MSIKSMSITHTIKFNSMRQGILHNCNILIDFILFPIGSCSGFYYLLDSKAALDGYEFLFLAGWLESG